jgi:hypothetical protein
VTQRHFCVTWTAVLTAVLNHPFLSFRLRYCSSPRQQHVYSSKATCARLLTLCFVHFSLLSIQLQAYYFLSDISPVFITKPLPPRPHLLYLFSNSTQYIFATLPQRSRYSIHLNLHHFSLFLIIIWDTGHVSLIHTQPDCQNLT